MPAEPIDLAKQKQIVKKEMIALVEHFMYTRAGLHLLADEAFEDWQDERYQGAEQCPNCRDWFQKGVRNKGKRCLVNHGHRARINCKDA